MSDSKARQHPPLTPQDLARIDADQAECNARAVAALARDMRGWSDSKITGHHARPVRTADQAPSDSAPLFDQPPPGHPAAASAASTRARSTPPARRGRPTTRGKL